MALSVEGFKKLSAGEKAKYLKAHPSSMHHPANKRAKLASSTKLAKVKPAEPDRKSKLVAIRSEIARLRARVDTLTTKSQNVRIKNTSLGTSLRKQAAYCKRLIGVNQKRLQKLLKTK